MIDLIPSSEQQEVADSIAAFLSDNLPVERHRKDRGRRGKQEPEVWQQLAELGCFGLSMPEAQGGVGLSLAEEVLAFREYGRYLVSPSILATVIATRMAAHAGKSELLSSLLAGRRRASIAQPLGASAPGAFYLIDADNADLVLTWNPNETVLFEGSAFKRLEEPESLDPSVTLSRAEVTGTAPLARVAASDEPLPLVTNLLLAAMLVGIIEAARDMSVSYAQTRIQFGVPIGSFQAIKHKCADVALGAEAAWSQTVYAALMLENSAPDALFQVLNAKMFASEAALRGAREAIQIHGGMGFTAELNAHLFLKRTHLLSKLGESPRELQRKLLELPLASV